MAATQLYNATTNAAIYPKITKDCLSQDIKDELAANTKIKLSTGDEDIEATKLVLNTSKGLEIDNNAGVITLSLKIGTGVMLDDQGKLTAAITAGTGIVISHLENGAVVVSLEE